MNPSANQEELVRVTHGPVAFERGLVRIDRLRTTTEAVLDLSNPMVGTSRVCAGRLRCGVAMRELIVKLEELLEDGGLFCACMDHAEVAAATALHPYECALPCAASGAASGNGRFHLTPTALPCGGNEAVAVYDTAATLEAMAAPCASADAAWPAAAAAAAASNPKFAECAPPEQLPCSAASRA